MIEAVRDKTGDPLAQPSAEELAADQMILQNVLRKLCIESGKSVVIADQIPAKGQRSERRQRDRARSADDGERFGIFR